MTTTNLTRRHPLNGPSARVSDRGRSARLFTAAYFVIAVTITVQLAIATTSFVAFLRGDAAAADSTRTALAWALIVFVFVLPSVAAVDLHTTQR